MSSFQVGGTTLTFTTDSEGFRESADSGPRLASQP